MAKQKVAYDENAIKSLDALAHIRLRTGMYIGRLGDGSNPVDGIYVLLKEVVDNSIDEFIMGVGKKVEISRQDDTVSIRDYGRGIPLGKVIECVSKINTGGKYNDDVFQFSVGLNGVGTKAVNALSSRFEVISFREGKFKRGLFERGKLKAEEDGRSKGEPDGTYVEFTPDKEIFKTYAWQDEYVEKRIQYYCYLNSGLTIVYNGKPFTAKNGLLDLLRHEIGQEPTHYEIVHEQGDKLEFAFSHTNTYGETYFSFVNGQYTNDGGTHLSAFREGVLKGINEFAGRSFAGEDVREGMIGAIAIKLQDPMFESQTKNKLGSDVRAWMVPAIKEAIEKWLHSDKAAAERLLEKIKTNEKIRTELAKIKKEAREGAPSRWRCTSPSCATARSTSSTSRTRPARNPASSSPRATRPAGRWCSAATSRPRPSSPSRASPSTATAWARTRCTRTRSSTTSCPRSASRTGSRGCATTRSSSPPTPTSTACTSATCC